MNILNIEIADFCEDGSTVSVSVLDKNDIAFDFYVQTVDGLYRSDLGCWLLTSDSDGDINQDDYPSIDFAQVIKQAEVFLSEQVEEKATEHSIDGEDVYLLISSNNVKVVTRNSRFINKDTSSYQREYSEPLYVADDVQDAEQYLANL